MVADNPGCPPPPPWRTWSTGTRGWGYQVLWPSLGEEHEGYDSQERAELAARMDFRRAMAARGAARCPSPQASLQAKAEDARDDAARKAWLSLAGYKFWMFGYHAAQWVLLNKLCPKARNPFAELVSMARAVCHVQGYKPTKGETDNG